MLQNVVFKTNGFIFKVSKKYVSKELAKEIHAKAAPFVKWLKEAEEESEGSEEEEEEDDENVEVKQQPHFSFILFYTQVYKKKKSLPDPQLGHI